MPSRASRSPLPENTAHVADRLHSAAIHLLRRLRAEDARTGLTGPRASVLSVLVFGGPTSVSALAAAEQVRPPTMTRLVAALEQKGLVSRQTSRTDGRVSLIRATRRGIALLQEGRGRRVARLESALRALPKRDLVALERANGALERLLRAL